MWQGFSLSLNTVQSSTPSKVTLCIIENLEQKLKKENKLKKPKTNKKSVKPTNNPPKPQIKTSQLILATVSVVENVEDKDPN